jgi:hypothetical protein
VASPVYQGEGDFAAAALPAETKPAIVGGFPGSKVILEGSIMRKSILGGLVAIGLWAGCGSAEDVGEESLGSREEELPFCASSAR